MSLLLKIVGSTLLFVFFASAANAAGTALVVLEPIFWIFRSDLTAIAVTFGLPAVAILVVLDFRNRVFNPLKNDIDYANKVFSGASDPQSYAEIDSEVDQSLSENRFLEPIWLEFRETMGEGKSASGEIVFQNTKRPKDYFTAEAISRDSSRTISISSSCWREICCAASAAAQLSTASRNTYSSSRSALFV